MESMGSWYNEVNEFKSMHEHQIVNNNHSVPGVSVNRCQLMHLIRRAAFLQVASPTSVALNAPWDWAGVATPPLLH